MRATIVGCVMSLLLSGCGRRYATVHTPTAPRSFGTAPAATPSMGHTTIAPFPVPGDTSRAAAEKLKALNVPKQGMTTIAPLPPPTDGRPPGDMLTRPGQDLPKFEDYVYVEELPEAIDRVPPEYPAAARRAGAEGTVMVSALVLKDGTVGDTRLVRSIPGLDEAAVACVRRWRFKPALTKGQPVAVWVGIPIKFSLH